MNAKPTPTPWFPRSFDTVFIVKGNDGVQVVSTSWHSLVRKPYPLKSEAAANVAFIVRACNSHDDLVAALKAQDDADRALASADELVGEAKAEGWHNDPTGSCHLGDAYRGAEKLREKARKLRDAALAKVEVLP